jgi:uncharacterized protein
MHDVDLAAVVARFGARLRHAGLPVGTDRCERFATAISLVQPATVAELRWCARTTLAGDHAQQSVLDAVFDEVFAGYQDASDANRGDPNAPPLTAPAPEQRGSRQPPEGAGGSSASNGSVPSGDDGRTRAEPAAIPVVASASERLAGTDFADLTEDELATLRHAMTQLTLATPTRTSRRTRRLDTGSQIDLRATLRLAHRSGGDPLRLVHRRRRDKPRRLVVLCDISGSMQAYARAMVQLLYCAAGGRDAEVFTFATRLTRLTPAMRGVAPAVALRRAGDSAPDWAGGTRIGAAVKEFIDRYGRRGMARGAVIVIISDGWDTGDPAVLGAQMDRLSGLAYRIVWVNPRTARPGYRPLVGGMAAAWPHCDAVVSAHRLSALDEFAGALSDPVRRRVRFHVKEHLDAADQ